MYIGDDVRDASFHEKYPDNERLVPEYPPQKITSYLFPMYKARVNTILFSVSRLGTDYISFQKAAIGGNRLEKNE
jgi:hypothetical protein